MCLSGSKNSTAKLQNATKPVLVPWKVCYPHSRFPIPWVRSSWPFWGCFSSLVPMLGGNNNNSKKRTPPMPKAKGGPTNDCKKNEIKNVLELFLLDYEKWFWNATTINANNAEAVLIWQSITYFHFPEAEAKNPITFSCCAIDAMRKNQMLFFN